jgi:phosphoserine phosphatase
MAIGHECFEQDVRHRIYREALDLVAQHRQQARPCYLVSSGPYMVLRSVGDFVGANSDWAPCPEIVDGVMQKNVREPLAYKEGKLEVAQVIADQQETSLDQAYFYTDSIDDIILLEAVGYPHVVNPDRHLKRVALQRSWPILNFNERLGRGAQ